MSILMLGPKPTRTEKDEQDFKIDKAVKFIFEVSPFDVVILKGVPSSDSTKDYKVFADPTDKPHTYEIRVSITPHVMNERIKSHYKQIDDHIKKHIPANKDAMKKLEAQIRATTHKKSKSELGGSGILDEATYEPKRPIEELFSELGMAIRTDEMLENKLVELKSAKSLTIKRTDLVQQIEIGEEITIKLPNGKTVTVTCVTPSFTRDRKPAQNIEYESFKVDTSEGHIIHQKISESLPSKGGIDIKSLNVGDKVRVYDQPSQKWINIEYQFYNDSPHLEYTFNAIDRSGIYIISDSSECVLNPYIDFKQINVGDIITCCSNENNKKDASTTLLVRRNMYSFKYVNHDMGIIYTKNHDEHIYETPLSEVSEIFHKKDFPILDKDLKEGDPVEFISCDVAWCLDSPTKLEFHDIHLDTGILRLKDATSYEKQKLYDFCISSVAVLRKTT